MPPEQSKPQWPNGEDKMADLSQILTLTGCEHQTIAWAAQQTVAVIQNRQNGSLTAEDATALLEDLKTQVQIAMAADSVENKVLIDNAISGVISIVGAVY
jgi:polyhydroxyalkanoate synthesis regulator phasin